MDKPCDPKPWLDPNITFKSGGSENEAIDRRLQEIPEWTENTEFQFAFGKNLEKIENHVTLCYFM